MKIAIVNGPNLNLLGIREPHLYGNQSFEDFLVELKSSYPEVTFAYIQSNSEGALLDALHHYGFSFDGIILNAAGYTHTSVALADAVAGISTPVIEVHISNIHAREAFRQHSFIAPHCKGSISGFGLKSYTLAVESFLLK